MQNILPLMKGAFTCTPLVHMNKVNEYGETKP